MEIESLGTRIILDCGLPLNPEPACRYSSFIGNSSPDSGLIADRLLQEVSGLCSSDGEATRIDAVIVSHAHLDHYGLLPFVNPSIPCYMSAGTARLVKMTSLLNGYKRADDNWHQVRSEQTFQIGALTITPFLVDHSAFDALAFLIKDPDSSLLYTGDFRQHGRKPHTIERLIEKTAGKVDVMIMEGTTIGRTSNSQYHSEQDVEDELTGLMKNSPGLALGWIASQNIDRLVSFYRACCRSQRVLGVDIYTAAILDEISVLAKIPHPSATYNRLKVFYSRGLIRRLPPAVRKDLIDKYRPYMLNTRAVQAYPERYLLLVRPSMMDVLRSYNHILPVSTLVSSVWEGYWQSPNNERFKHYLDSKGVSVVSIHTSGHADPATLQNVVNTIQPGCLIPLHTQHPEAFAALWPKVCIAKDGECLSF